MGTSVGTITLITPIAAPLAVATGFSLPFCVASVIGGAMFGDNLSFISDTTIAACNGQGCQMKDKFRENFKIALPAALASLVIILIISLNTTIEQFPIIKEYNLVQIIPYVLVLVGGIIGINVFVVLLVGILSGSIIMLATGEIAATSLLKNMGTGAEGILVLDQTPFYAEMGGQVADHGVLTSADCSLRVLDVKKTPKGYYVHTCVLESGIVKVGDHLTAKVDKEYRMAVCRNHTATHLLQAALREVLGDHVHQAGSYQDGEITHFDFTHFSAVTADELARVEKIVNDRIFDAMDVTVKEMPIDEAKKLGAMALFGEKYGKVVRVVDIEGWSTEFCGGTHVRNTAQIGCFKIVSESSVAAGIRRIEAVTGKNLLLRANKQETMLHTVAAALKANNVAGLPARAEAVMAENKAMSKELDDMKAKIAASKVTSLFDDAEEVGGVKIASAYFTGTSGDTLRGMCDTVRDKAVNPVVAVLVGKAEDKITMAVTVNKMAQEKGLKAGVLVKEISAIAGGKGGGKPDFAMAGLKDETRIDEALAAVKGIVEKQLG